jgi:HAAS
MADRDLINSYLAELARRLPGEAVEELADGLEETYQHQLRLGLSPTEAAHSAISEFGRPVQVAAAFAHQSSGRRTAIALLVTAPVFAGLWGTTLITAHAWNWPIPPGAAVTFGAALLAVAVTLVIIARSNNPTTTRLAGPASVALVLLDLDMLTAVAAAAPTVTWPMALAIPASLIRVALAGRNLPRVFAR